MTRKVERSYGVPTCRTASEQGQTDGEVDGADSAFPGNERCEAGTARPGTDDSDRLNASPAELRGRGGQQLGVASLTLHSSRQIGWRPDVTFAQLDLFLLPRLDEAEIMGEEEKWQISKSSANGGCPSGRNSGCPADWRGLGPRRTAHADRWRAA
jgi:hypothetical protein